MQGRKIEEMMLAMRDDVQAANLSRFFKTGPGQYGEGDEFLGVKVPQTREVVKSVWADCSLEDVDYLLRSQYHELRLCALLILVRMFKAAQKAARSQAKLQIQAVPGIAVCPSDIVDFYLAHTSYINNWDLVDLSCDEILGAWVLENSDSEILYHLARNGRTMWEQRIAMVSCMALVRAGELENCFSIADILLHHKHDLMHKAVGWLLREAGKRDGQALRDFLKTRYKSMPRTMLRYAIEKFPEEERKQYLRGEL